ncbi:hypothetical protein [Nocardioides abyssi]|uniref:Phosphatidylinositol mannoside acyltransferase n=1 Tax=Nocardioides abyssi TaxID=3058370 RepID=A0ABT8EX02_9ACTN|nr:hypothetical protein [Nocardioides abyssi]MDN4162491.1 hypothetical protein [Nocardioides abyssi]
MSSLAAAVSWGRRHIPDAAVPAVTRARLTRARKNQDRLARAHREMEFLLGGACTPAEVDRAAERYVERDILRSELRWHPNLITFQEVEGVEHLVAARKRGRGVVISFLHHGHYEGAVASVCRADRPLLVVVSPEMLAPDAPEFLKQHVRTGTVSGGRPLDATVGAKGMLKALHDGNVLAIASDVPGRTPIRFLGVDRLGSFGAARLAAGAGCPVVSMTAHPDADGKPYLRLSEPLEPGDFASPDDLLLEMVQLQEAPALAWPEAYHQPTLRWGAVQPASSAAAS